MTEKSIVFLRSNPVDPDSRVEKEINALTRVGYHIEVVAWDRNAKYKIKKSYLYFEEKKSCYLSHRNHCNIWWRN